MKHVLIALRDREEAGRLVAAAAALTRGGEEVGVEVVQVLEPGTQAAFAGTDVTRAVDLLASHGVTGGGRVEPIVDGSVARTLAERAGAAGSDLVVLGSRGRGEVRGLVGGSVSHELLAAVDLPVLILPRGSAVGPAGFQRVLAAVLREDDVAPMVAALALLPGHVEVLAVHVPRRVALHAGEGVADPFLELGVETSTSVLATAAGGFAGAGLGVATRSIDRDGGIASAICETAAGWDADLIVLGPRRPGAWSALLSGSTSHSVIQHAGRPVLIAGRRALS